jgi:putative ABC transport system permease protein
VSVLRALRAGLKSLFRKELVDRELDDELRHYHEQLTREHMRAGAPRTAAERAAWLELGGLEATKERVRASGWEVPIDLLWRDVRYAVRVLRRSPRFTATALTLLILAIGSTTAIYSIAYAVLVRPLPYPDAERLVFVGEKNGGGIAWPDFEDWRQRASSFDGLASSLADAVVEYSSDVPRRFESRSVSSNFFQVLGISSIQGRLFTDADARANADPTVVISHALWMDRFAGSARAIGQTITLNRRPYTVIGVLPPGFRYETPADVYLLLEPQVARDYRGMQSRRTHTTLFAVGRLKAGVSLNAAGAEMEGIAAALAAEYPNTNKNSEVKLVGLAKHIVGDFKPALTVLAGAVTLLLLIASINLVGLLLNRGVSRAHEFSIRAAIGGSRQSLIRQLIVEHALLVATGGVLGALGGAAIFSGLINMAPPDLPRLDEIHLDVAALSWITLFSCAFAFGFGIMPALKASGIGGQGLVVRSRDGSTRWAAVVRRGLLTAEIALATVLLSGAGLMVQTMLRLSRVDPGFDLHNVQSFMFSLTGPLWPDARKQVFYGEVVERLRAVPSVENAAIVHSLPFFGSMWWNGFTIADQSAAFWEMRGERPNAAMVPVSSGYFETLRIPLLQGRYFDRSDQPASLPVAIVNNSMARKYWADQSAIGKRIRQGFPPDSFGPWRTIVGIVGDVRQHGLDVDVPPQIFMPVQQQPRSTVFAVVRGRGPLNRSTLEAALHDLDRTVPVFNHHSVEQVLHDAYSRRRIAMVVLSVFAGVAVLLAAIGLYGLIAQGVTERRKEIGIRMSMGATAGQVQRLFLREGVAISGFGVMAGLLAAVAASATLRRLIFGVSPTDPLTLSSVALLLTATALAACYLPARAAARVDPAATLHGE